MRRHQLSASPTVAGIANAASILKVGAALPDPPFEFMSPDGPTGFDVALMQRIAQQLGREWQLVAYTGADFNGIFAGLDSGTYDCVASGTTMTPDRERIVDFCQPYAVSGQSLVVDAIRHPNVRGMGDLTGLVIGVQRGNTSQPVAEKFVAERRAARVRVYAYDAIEEALNDLTTGGCDAFMKLAPVTEWFSRDRPRLRVVETGITRERLAVCVRKGDIVLRDAIDTAQAILIKNGTVLALMKQWLGTAAVAS